MNLSKCVFSMNHNTSLNAMNDRETKRAIKFLKERARLDARRRPVVDLNDALKALKLAGHNISIRHIVEIE